MEVYTDDGRERACKWGISGHEAKRGRAGQKVGERTAPGRDAEGEGEGNKVYIWNNKIARGEQGDDSLEVMRGLYSTIGREDARCRASVVYVRLE